MTIKLFKYIILNFFCRLQALKYGNEDEIEDEDDSDSSSTSTSSSINDEYRSTHKVELVRMIWILTHYVYVLNVDIHCVVTYILFHVSNSSVVNCTMHLVHLSSLPFFKWFKFFPGLFPGLIGEDVFSARFLYKFGNVYIPTIYASESQYQYAEIESRCKYCSVLV